MVPRTIPSVRLVQSNVLPDELEMKIRIRSAIPGFPPLRTTTPVCQSTSRSALRIARRSTSDDWWPSYLPSLCRSGADHICRPSRLGPHRPGFAARLELDQRVDVRHFTDSRSDRTLPVVAMSLHRQDDALVISTEPQHSVG